MKDRCPECGDWWKECGNPKPVPDCRCSRCATVEIKRLQRLLDDARSYAKDKETESEYYRGQASKLKLQLSDALDDLEMATANWARAVEERNAAQENKE